MNYDLWTQGHKPYQITQTRQLCGRVLCFLQDYQMISWGVVSSHHKCFSEEKRESYCLMCKSCHELHIAQPRRKIKGTTTTSCVGRTSLCTSGTNSSRNTGNAFLYIGRPWLIRKSRFDYHKWSKSQFRKITSDRKNPRVGESSY